MINIQILLFILFKDKYLWYIINMSDYSFLKTGFSNLIEPVKLSEKEREDIEIMLGLFTSNALINASKYVQFCGRNAITKTDILYGLQYEVFEFLQRNDLNEGLDEIRKDYEKLKLEEYEVDDDEFNEDEDEDEYEDIENEINEQDNDKQGIDLQNTELGELIISDDEAQEFSRINEEKINDENREFIEKFHHYNDTWSTWQPESDLESILKVAIDKIN